MKFSDFTVKVILVLAFLLRTNIAYAQVDAPTTIPEHSLGKVAVATSSNNDYIEFDIPESLSVEYLSPSTFIFTGAPGLYRCKSRVISIDFETKKVSGKTYNFTLNILGVIPPNPPKPTPEPVPTPTPVPVPVSDVKKVVIVYETDSTTPELYNLLSSLRLKVTKPLYFIDNDLPNQFSIKEDGCHLLDKDNKIIKTILLNNLSLEELDKYLK